MAHAGTPITVLDRSLHRGGEETAAATQGDQLEAAWTVRFEQAIASPQATFRILAEDGTLAYSMHTTFGEPWRTFAPGDTTEVRIAFQPQFGGGGTFRLLLDLSDVSGAHVLGADLEGLRVYVPPRYGTGGLGDALASISIGGRPMTDHASLAFDGPRS